MLALLWIVGMIQQGVCVITTKSQITKCRRPGSMEVERKIEEIESTNNLKGEVSSKPQSNCTVKLVFTIALDASESEELVVNAIPRPAVPFWEEKTEGLEVPKEVKKMDIRLSNPVRIRVEKSAVRALYPLTYIQRVNGDPRELVDKIGAWQGTQDEDPLKQHRGTKCEVHFHPVTGKPIIETGGFACHCTVSQSLGLSGLSKRNTSKCGFFQMLINAKTSTVHCMRPGLHWWNVFSIGAPLLEWEIKLSVTRTVNGEEITKTSSITARDPNKLFDDIGFTRVVGDFALTEKLPTFGDVYLVRKAMSKHDELRAGRRLQDVIQEIEEHGVPEEQIAVSADELEILIDQRLATLGSFEEPDGVQDEDSAQASISDIRERPETNPRRLTGVTEGRDFLDDRKVPDAYLLGRHLFDFGDSAACNKIGVSMKSFARQGSRCEQEANSCLRRQINDFIQPDRHWNKIFCPGASPDGSKNFRVLFDWTPTCLVTQSHVTELAFTLDAVDMAVIIGDPPARIIAVLVSGNTEIGRSQIDVTVKVYNMDANFSGHYRVGVADCDGGLASSGSAQSLSIGPLLEESVYFQLRTDGGKKGRYFCTAAVYGLTEGELMSEMRFPVDLKSLKSDNFFYGDGQVVVPLDFTIQRQCKKLHWLDLINMAKGSCFDRLIFFGIRATAAALVFMLISKGGPLAYTWAVNNHKKKCEKCGKFTLDISTADRRIPPLARPALVAAVQENSLR